MCVCEWWLLTVCVVVAVVNVCLCVCDGGCETSAKASPSSLDVKSLVLKNVSVKTQKLKYRIPHTKFFSMDFPEVITLSPGTSIIVDVIFRPIRYEGYADVVVLRKEARKMPETEQLRVANAINKMRENTTGDLCHTAPHKSARRITPRHHSRLPHHASRTPSTASGQAQAPLPSSDWLSCTGECRHFPSPSSLNTAPIAASASRVGTGPIS